MEGSQIFDNYRALGYYTNHVPIQVLYHERLKESFIVTSVGKSYHIYNASKLGLTRVSDPLENDIACLMTLYNRIYYASEAIIYSCERNKQDVITFQGHDHNVHTLVPFGKHFISIDCKSNVIVWEVATPQKYLELNFSIKTFEISCAVHPATYVNKILFASTQGSLQLWNVRQMKKIYEFFGWGSGVTILKQAPAADVMGIGLASGDIYLHNLKYDETVLQFKQEWGPVTSLSFRTDGAPIMMSGSTVGHIAIWNLENKQLSNQLRKAHDATVSGLECLSNEPLMVTTSADNNIKIWVFDQSDGGARLLHRRQGHSRPVFQVKFYDETTVLSAGQDCLIHLFSTDHDRHNKSLGRAVWNKKSDVKQLLPSFTSFSCESRRGSDWDDVIATHAGCNSLTCWSVKKSTLSRLVKLRDKSDCPTCVTLSQCGNFAFVGFNSGEVEQVNMQSKISRGVFTGHHTGSIRGVEVDQLTQYIVTGSSDSTVIIWRIKKQKYVRAIRVTAPVSSMKIHHGSGMVAAALDDFSISLIDMETQRLVRRFQDHSGRITSLTFNPAGSWLITSSMDSTVCTWDIITGNLIDRANTHQVVTCLDMSPQGEFLVLSLLDEPGVYLWSNRSLYSHISLKSLNSVDQDVDMSDMKDQMKMSDSLIKLSNQPESRWANLLKLDIIKYKNRLKAPPKIQKAAPFFLPTVAGLKPQFDLSAEQNGEGKSETKKKVTFNSSSGLDRALFDSIEQGDATPYLTLMKSFGVATIESELRCLSPDPGVAPDLLLAFLQVTKLALLSNKDYELINSYLALCLKLNSDDIMNNTELLEELERVYTVTEKSWSELDLQFNKSRCLVSFQRSAIL